MRNERVREGRDTTQCEGLSGGAGGPQGALIASTLPGVPTPEPEGTPPRIKLNKVLLLSPLNISSPSLTDSRWGQWGFVNPCMRVSGGKERKRNERVREGRDTTQAYPANTNRATVTARSEGSPMCTSDGIVRRLLDLINAGLFKSPGTITYPARVAVRRVRVRCDYDAVACVQGNRILVA